MPIYVYRCESCGFGKDVLQKISDAPITVCPSCASSSFKKQLTAAGFQLKGTGWYVTDFRNGSGGSNTTAPATAASATEGAAPAAKPADSGGATAVPATGTTGSSAAAGGTSPAA